MECPFCKGPNFDVALFTRVPLGACKDCKKIWTPDSVRTAEDAS